METVVQIDGILAKGSYPPCLRMADRALLDTLEIGQQWYQSINNIPARAAKPIKIYVQSWDCQWVYVALSITTSVMWLFSTAYNGIS